MKWKFRIYIGDIREGQTQEYGKEFSSASEAAKALGEMIELYRYYVAAATSHGSAFRADLRAK